MSCFPQSRLRLLSRFVTRPIWYDLAAYRPWRTDNPAMHGSTATSCGARLPVSCSDKSVSGSFLSRRAVGPRSFERRIHIRETELRNLRFSLALDLRGPCLAQRTAPESFQSGGQGPSPWRPTQGVRDLRKRPEFSSAGEWSRPWIGRLLHR